MAQRQLAANHGDEVSQVGTMADVSDQGPVLFVNRLPIGSMHVGVVKVLALNTPRLAKDLLPLSARIDAHLQLGHVEWSIAHLDRRGTIGCNDPPTGSAASAA